MLVHELNDFFDVCKIHDLSIMVDLAKRNSRSSLDTAENSCIGESVSSVLLLLRKISPQVSLVALEGYR